MVFITEISKDVKKFWSISIWA